MSEDGLLTGEDGKVRCFWQQGLEDYRRYHDDEWGYPVADDKRLFEKICLEGFQSGLSWLTILRKRESFRAAFAGFDFDKVASFDDTDIERCLADKGIVRHRGKIVSTINNARRAVALREEFGSLARYFWSFEPKQDERPEVFDYATLRAKPNDPCVHAAIQRSEEARLEFRWADDRLCFHAGDGHGQRPYRGLPLSPTDRSDAAGVCTAVKTFLRCALACLLIASVSVPAVAEQRNVDGMWLDDGEQLKAVEIPASGNLRLNGWTRQGRGEVYRLKVKAGETLKVSLASRSEFVVMAIFDFGKPDDDAIFFSDTGNNTTTLTPAADTEWLIRPILVLSSSRRGLGANYTITVERQP